MLSYVWIGNPIGTDSSDEKKMLRWLKLTKQFIWRCNDERESLKIRSKKMKSIEREESRQKVMMIMMMGGKGEGVLVR